MSITEIQRNHVIEAIEEYDLIGQTDFLIKYGFKKSTRWLITYKNRYYEPKAILLVAHKFAVGKPIDNWKFSGGPATNSRLSNLGFEIVSKNEILHTRPVRTWIFQANPDRFAIDEYLSTRPDPITWLVTSHVKDIRPDDLVYIWRAKGKEDKFGAAGIIAEAVVVEAPTQRLDDAISNHYWTDAEEIDSKKMRAVLKIVRILEDDILREKAIEADPVLKGLSILKMRNATNFQVTPNQAEQLKQLWLGMQPLGYYGEDGRDAQEALDRAVSQRNQIPMEILKARCEDYFKNSSGRPRSRISRSRVYERNPDIVAYALRRAHSRCEVPNCTHPIFEGTNGLPYCEIHHIQHLAREGSDSINNVACLCPSHHREIHLGKNANELTEILLQVRLTE